LVPALARGRVRLGRQRSSGSLQVESLDPGKLGP
jgi:hypothetical protein